MSKDVDAALREQIKANVFPLRLKPENWRSGDINWLLDIIAPDQDTALKVLRNFGSVVSEGDLRLHPTIAQALGKEKLLELGLRVGKPEGAGSV